MIANLLAGIVAKLGAAGVAAKAGVGLAVAAASVSGAAAVGVLPDVSSSPSQPVEAVTTVDVSNSEEIDASAGDSEETTDAAQNGFGASVSADASDPESPAVDGSAVSEAARTLGAQHRPSTPGSPADAAAEGLSRAGDTPAAGHLPAAIPAGPSTADQYRPETPVADAQANTPSKAPERPVAGPSGETPAARQTIPAGPPENAPARNR